MVEKLTCDMSEVANQFSTLLSFKNSQSEELNSTNNIHIPVINKPIRGDVWNVYVSNINSLKYVHVQNIENYEYIQLISTELDKHVSTLTKLPKVGDLIAARDYDGVWFRATVESITELGLYVTFIDFGISQALVTEFKDLPKELYSVTPMAFYCCLRNVSKEIDNRLSVLDLFDAIRKFFNCYQITTTFLSNNEPYLVTLSHNKNDVLDIVYNLVWDGIVPGISDDPINCAKIKMLNKIFPNSKTEVANIGPVLSMNHFYVETELSYQTGKAIRTEIENHTKWIPVLHPEEGQIVIAKNTNDLKLYRARVIMKYHNCEKYKCFLIDCMTFENCSEMFKPSDYLRTAPPIKLHCSLDISKKCCNHILESINLAFIDEIAKCIGESKVMHVKEIDNPCVIDLEIGNLNLFQVIEPCEVTVINYWSMNYFSVRLNSSEAKQIQHVLNTTKILPTVSNPELFKLYVAKNESQYKRVKYLGKNEFGLRVKLVDEFVCQKIFVGELYELPNSIVNKKTTDLPCSLGLDKLSYSNRLFVDICKNGKTKFKMVVINDNGINALIVKLFLDCNDITLMICNQPSY
ncbi:Nuclease domain-containing protein 1 [Aphis craccivora]|uniref:Nuclease domain-containing protein 1 n=1 Tax=Aphis craccivora TaxID=307492 RepID=A0A6G0ZMJ7_APHCR|nr:Nuclease domain-containing protein 1 [Aphis craccivora]